MPAPRFLTITQQAAAYLREQIELGRWTSWMPGRHELARELELSHQTVENALVQLEKDGFLQSRGRGRRRQITQPEGGKAAPRLRIAMLLWRRRGPYINDLQHRLLEAGHEPFPTRQGLMDLDMDAGRVRQLVAKAKVFVATQQFLASRGLSVPGDVWVVCPDGDAVLDWQLPTAAQFKWDSTPWVRRAVRWAENISRGKDDRRQVLYPARFVPGGTIGPAPQAP